jgi:hypothetical protein
MENCVAKPSSWYLGALILLMPLCALSGQTVIGTGSMNCEIYSQADDDIKFGSENWALGFLTAANLRSKNLDLLVAVDSIAVIAALENFCQSHPENNIADASMQVLKDLVSLAEGDCSVARINPVLSKALNRCDNPASIENSNEPTGWSMIIPAVE